MTAAEVQKIIAVLEKLTAFFRRQLRGSSEDDAFADHVYCSRSRFLEESANGIPRGPSGKIFVIASYDRAKELGFHGSADEWLAVLRARPRG